MARVPYLDPDDVDAPEDHRILSTWPNNSNRAFARSPGALPAVIGFAGWIRGTSLDPRLRELAVAQVGYVTRVAYEWVHHVRIGIECGATEADMRAIADETEGRPTHLGELESLVLRATREMTNDIRVSDATFARLREHLDERQLVELVLTVGFYNQAVRVLASLDIDVEPGYESVLADFPLPTD